MNRNIKETIFSKIINNEVKSNIIYKDKIVTAFYDINPKAPIHILIVTNKIIKSLDKVSLKYKNLLGHIIVIASKIAKKKNISKDGYRIIFNCNKNGGQEIYHLHAHLLGGKYLGPLI